MLDVSGGSRIVAGHAQRLAARGHEVLIVNSRPGRVPLKQRARALFGFGSPDAQRKRSHFALASVPVHVPHHAGPIEERDVPDADVIIATWWETAEWISSFSARKGAKVHLIQHYEAFPGMPADRVDAVWRLPFFKIAIAQLLVDLGRERFGIEEMALVPNSVDERFFSTLARNKGDPPMVGFLFHNAGFKDVPTTVAAIERLKRSQPDARFLSFGSVMPTRGELPADVEFHHLPTQEQIANIYSRCDAWLSTSRSEGFNLPPLEAMASGCPAVCSRTGRPLEIIKDGINGYLVDQGDVTGFSEALAKILSLPDQPWRSMSEAARCSVAHPTWDESSALFEQALMRAA